MTEGDPLNAEQVAVSIRKVAARLRDTSFPEAIVLRQNIAQVFGHHPEVIEEGLQSTLLDLDHALEALVASRPSKEPKLDHAIVLAGNVFTASFRPLVTSLLAGCYTRVKLPSTGDPFAKAFLTALQTVDERTHSRTWCESFSREDTDAMNAFVEDADTVSVFGRQNTIDRIGERLRPDQRLIAHGPGFGAIFIDEHDLSDLETRCAQIAEDIIAYDQAGCLSPHVIWLDAPYRAAVDFGEALLVALEDHIDTRPHRLSTEAAAAILNWRAEACATGTLLGDQAHGLWLRQGATFRPSPGQRHLTIAVCDQDAQQRAIDAAGSLLKAVATPLGHSPEHSFSKQAPPRKSALGQMQRPPLDNTWDGRSVWDGLFAP